MATIAAVDSSGNTYSGWRSAADSLHRRFSQWTITSWNQAITGAAGAPNRADAVFEAINQLAALTATHEGEPLRRVPRLESPLALPDQFAVVVEDLTRAAGAQGRGEAFTILVRLARACGLPTPA